MQGACVYVNNDNLPTILMYKELEDGKSFVIFYNKVNITSFFTSVKTLTTYFPHDCIHILYTLPFHDDYEKMSTSWKNVVKERLLSINNDTQSKSPLQIPIPIFKQKFKAKTIPPFRL